MINYRIIHQPIVTEKSVILKEKSNQFFFEVDKNANRVEIKKAVEQIFKVKVVSVNTIQVKGKIKRKGSITGKRKDWKKAIVKLMPGERIEFFEGV